MNSGQTLDSTGQHRHLATSGCDALVREVEKAATKSRTPFLAANAPLAKARVRRPRGFPALTPKLGLSVVPAYAMSGADNAVDVRLQSSEGGTRCMAADLGASTIRDIGAGL